MKRKRTALLALVIAVPALLLAGGVCFLVYLYLSRTAAVRARPQPVIICTASYPGASAQVVADTVAAPIEQQILGAEGLAFVTSRCNQDGSCIIQTVWHPGTDADMALVRVQNRVSLALPTLPDVVRITGVSVKRKPAGILLFAALTSSDAKFDTLYLSNCAREQLIDPLTRMPGVARVTLLGARDVHPRLHLDSDKLTARGLTSADVVRAIREQNVQVPAGQIGQPPAPGEGLQFTLSPPGRLALLDDLGMLVVKNTADGGKILLRDVGRIEMSSRQDNFAFLNGTPAVIVCVYANGLELPDQLPPDLQQTLKDLRDQLPVGLELDASFDLPSKRSGSPVCWLVDMDLPDSASKERIHEALNRCTKLLQEVDGVQDVLGLNAHPFDLSLRRACLLVRLKPRADREKTRDAIRAQFQEIPDALLRLRDLSGQAGSPQFSYHLEGAVHGPEGDQVRQLAQDLAERLNRTELVTEAAQDRDSWPTPQLYCDIDRTKAQQMGVPIQDILATLEGHLGPTHVNDFNRFGRTLEIVIQPEARFRTREGLRGLLIRSSKGERVPLASVVQVRDIQASPVVERLDGLPMVRVTANCAPGASPARARALCEKLAAEVLPAEYQWTWLR